MLIAAAWNLDYDLYRAMYDLFGFSKYISISRISFTLLYLYDKVRRKGGWVVG